MSSRHRGLGDVPALLAAPACGHRRRAGQRRRPGHPRRGLLRRGHHHAGRRGRPPCAGRRPGRRRRCRTCSSPRPTRRYLDKTSATTVHAALGLGRACGAYDFAGSSRSAVGTLLQALGGGGRQWPHDPGRALRPAHRPGRLGRGARQRRRRRRLRVRARRCGGRADRPRGGQRRVPRPLARPGRGRLARVGGALRRGALRAAGPRGLRGGAQGRRAGRGRRRPRHRDRAARAGGQGRLDGPRRPRRRPGAGPHRVGRATSAPPRPPWRCATCSSGPSRGR